jgi:ABC-type multidrug transport system ATPase subunit
LIKTSEINIYTNDIDYINNSYYFKNTPNKIKFNNITNFENISDFAYFIKNNSKLMNERSAILFKKENEIIKIYNLYQGSAPDYFQATMNMLINIISEKEFNLYINSGKQYGDLDIFIYFNDRNLYTYFFVIEIIIIFIANLSHIPFKEKQNNISHLLYLNGNSKLNYWIGIFISDIFRIIIYIIIIFIFFYIQEFMFSFLIDITLCLFASCMFIYFISLFYSQIHIFLFFIYFHLFIFIVMILSYFMIFLYSLNINQSFIQIIESLKNWNYKFTISDMCPITSLITLFIRLLINNNSMNNKKSKNENLLFIYKIIFVIQIIVYGFLFYLIEIKECKIKSKENKNIKTKSINEMDDNKREKSVSKKDIDLFGNPLNEDLSINESNLLDSFISKDIFLNIMNLTYNIVKYNKLKCCKKKTPIINNLNLELKINEKIGLCGKSGSGKSSILKSIIQENEYSGEIYLLGKNIKENFNELRKEIGYCPQKNILIDEITVIDCLNFYKDVKVNSNEFDLNNLINLLGLKKYLNKKCKNLSEGNKRKLCFVISILNRPKLLLLDNPTVGIDTKTRKIIWNYLKTLDYKYHMILVSNDIDEIEYLCDKVSLLKEGSLKFNETIEHLKIAHSIGYIFKFDLKKENIDYENNDNLLEGLKNKIKNLDKLDDGFKNDYECLNKLNQIINYLENNYNDIEFNNSYYDNFSLQFIIKIDNEKKGKLFSLILNLKNKFNFILDLFIQNESLEKILSSLNN